MHTSITISIKIVNCSFLSTVITTAMAPKASKSTGKEIGIGIGIGIGVGVLLLIAIIVVVIVFLIRYVNFYDIL